ncbi:MAG: hypothetical protein HRU32_00960 [Rhodobacteraceae bacterium]|nr:hypothetical protein [Paracoccaceae bacterium]
MALKADLLNPALDAGDDALTPSVDARGFDRLVDVPGADNNGANTSDIGA